MGLKGKRNRGSLYYNRSRATQSSISLSYQPPPQLATAVFLLLSLSSFASPTEGGKNGRGGPLINTWRLRISPLGPLLCSFGRVTMHPLKRLNGQASVLAVLQSEEEEGDGPSGGGLPQVHERILDVSGARMMHGQRTIPRGGRRLLGEWGRESACVYKHRHRSKWVLFWSG